MAGTTTNRAYPYPTSGDAANIAANIQSLATSIDTDVNTNFALKASPTLTTPTITNTLLVNTNATSFIKQAATVAPTVDMLQIANTGFPILTAGVSAIQVNYVGGAAAVEASASRVDITPGTTTGGTWNGFRVLPTAAAATGVTYNAMKFDAITAGAGTDNVIFAGTGYDNIINYNGTTVINGTGQLALGQVTGTLSIANGGTNQTGTITTVAPVVTTTPLALATNYKVSITPNATVTFTTTVPAAGVECTLIILTSGVTSYTITFGTGFLTQGTLATGTVTAKTFAMKFISNGTTLIETARTIAM